VQPCQCNRNRHCNGYNELCLQACRRHGTAPTASAALGRALIGTLLMGSFKEEGERTQVTFKGNGSLGSMQVKRAGFACNGWLFSR